MSGSQELFPAKDEVEHPEFNNAEGNHTIRESAVNPTGARQRRVLPKRAEESVPSMIKAPSASAFEPYPQRSKITERVAHLFIRILKLFSNTLLNILRGCGSFSTWFLGGESPSQFLLKAIVLVAVMTFVYKEWQDFKPWLATVPHLTKETTIALYCSFIGWKCHTGKFQIPNVVEGMIQDVGNARDVFEMIAELGSSRLVPLQDNHIQ